MFGMLYVSSQFPRCFRTAALYHYDRSFIINGSWIECGIIEDAFVAWDVVADTSYILSIKNNIVLQCLQNSDFCPDPQPDMFDDKICLWTYEYLTRTHEAYLTYNPSRNI